jgi:aspartate aminotransferase-like enzyme
MFDEAKHLRIPGPSPVPPSVQRESSRPMVAHRSSDFMNLAKQCINDLKEVFQTNGQIAILTGSGTAAMESAVANLISPQDTALVLSGGKFGERWTELVKAYKGNPTVISIPYGQGVDVKQVEQVLQSRPDIKVVFATQNESSTAVMNDIEGIAAVTKAHDAILVVDAVSGLGGIPLYMDAWGVDVVVTGSQKCLMLPPGLSFVAANEKAINRMKANQSPRYYFNLAAYFDDVLPYTPNVALFYGLRESLRLIKEEGLENSYKRHRLMRDMVRAGIKAMGLPLFVDEESASLTVTAVSGVEGLDVEAFRKLVEKKCGVILASGQGEMKGKIFRIGHMGYATPLDMLATLAAIEVGLILSGFSVTPGIGVKAAEEVWVNAN